MSKAAIASAPQSSTVTPWRIAAALLLIPLADALLGYLAFPLVWWLGDHGAARLVAPRQPAQAFGMLAGVLALFVMITVAVPATQWLMRRGLTSLHHFAIAGVVLGNFPFAAYLWAMLGFTLLHLAAGTLADHLSPFSELLAAGLRAVVIGSVMGAASGVMFWLIVGLRPGHEGPRKPVAPLAGLLRELDEDRSDR